ncbi:MAG: ATP-binding protein, partial [Armatimonadia bacterium]
VVRQYQPEGWPVAVDPAEVGRILLNLVINAIHAMPRGGRLTVSTEYAPATSGREELVLTVADTGTGIRLEDLPHIFEPFFTTKAKSEDGHGQGTGLGLCIVQGIVTSHGGSIVVRTEVGVGTTFEVHLPVVANGNHLQHDEADNLATATVTQ